MPLTPPAKNFYANELKSSLIAGIIDGDPRHRAVSKHVWTCLAGLPTCLRDVAQNLSGSRSPFASTQPLYRPHDASKPVVYYQLMRAVY